MGSNTTETLTQSFFMLASKVIGMLVKVDDVDVLLKDLQEDFVLNSTLSSVNGEITLRCGRLPTVANAALITAKHIDFEKELKKNLQWNLSNNLAKKLTKNLQKRSPYYIQHGESKLMHLRMRLLHLMHQPDASTVAPADAQV